MGKVSMPYSSLSDASREAKAVASKINTRETILYKNVYLKLNSYDGRWSDNLGNVKSKVNAKRSELQREERRYRDYADDLIDLREECKRVDEAVKIQK